MANPFIEVGGLIPWIKPSYWKEFDVYRDAGGGLGYDAWAKEYRRTGKAPQAPVKLSAYAADVLKRAGQPIPAEARVAPQTPGEVTSIAKRQAEAVTKQVAGAGGAPAGGVSGMPVRWETVTEGGWSYNVGYDAKGNVVSREPLGRVETQKPPEAEKPPYQWGAPGEIPQDPYGRKATWNARLGQWEYPPDWGQKTPEKDEGITPYQQKQLDLEYQQLEQQQAYQQQQLQWNQQQSAAQQAEQERQYKSQLAANPMSWLQYASYTGQNPVVQPWMMPLSQGQYGWQTGQQIPGFSPSGGSEMPELLRPSAQLMARMGPTAGAQYKGYQQYTQGATPEETEFRLASTSAPGGRYTPLRWAR